MLMGLCQLVVGLVVCRRRSLGKVSCLGGCDQNSVLDGGTCMRSERYEESSALNGENGMKSKIVSQYFWREGEPEKEDLCDDHERSPNYNRRTIQRGKLSLVRCLFCIPHPWRKHESSLHSPINGSPITVLSIVGGGIRAIKPFLLSMDEHVWLCDGYTY
ncbi:unnamed protein product [Prunus armeniaca]